MIPGAADGGLKEIRVGFAGRSVDRAYVAHIAIIRESMQLENERRLAGDEGEYLPMGPERQEPAKRE